MLVLLVLCAGLIGGCYGQQAKKYNFMFESELHLIGDVSSKYLDVSRVNCERHNESTAVMYGEIEFLQKLDSLILEIILKKEAAGKHEVLFTHDICNLCSELGKSDGNYKEYLNRMLIPEECPLEAGSYKIEDLVVDIDKFEINDSQCGPYLAELHMYKSTGDSCKNDKELLFTIKLDFSIEREG